MFNTRSHLSGLIDTLKKDIKENPDRRQTELATLQAALAQIDKGLPSADGVPRKALTPTVRSGTKKADFRRVVDGLLDAAPDKRVHRKAFIENIEIAAMFSSTNDLDRDVSKYLSMDGSFAPAGDGYWKKKDKELKFVKRVAGSSTP